MEDFPKVIIYDRNRERLRICWHENETRLEVKVTAAAGRGEGWGFGPGACCKLLIVTRAKLRTLRHLIFPRSQDGFSCISTVILF